MKLQTAGFSHLRSFLIEDGVKCGDAYIVLHDTNLNRYGCNTLLDTIRIATLKTVIERQEEDIQLFFTISHQQQLVNDHYELLLYRMSANSRQRNPESLRFGCPLHYETERGEMFNRFIRQMITHTNRSSIPSLQAAIRFGRRSCLKHIADGVSWINDSGARVSVGKSIQDFISANNPDFQDYFFGGIFDFADNNEIFTNVRGGSRLGHFGLFQPVGNSSYSFIGQVVDDNKVQEFDVDEQHPLTLSCQLLCKESAQFYDLSDLKRVVELGMFQEISASYRYLKMNKFFGTIMLLKNHHIYAQDSL